MGASRDREPFISITTNDLIATGDQNIIEAPRPWELEFVQSLRLRFAILPVVSFENTI